MQTETITRWEFKTRVGNISVIVEAETSPKALAKIYEAGLQDLVHRVVKKVL